ncbi:MAG: T9SS type A sorting domain-containing protein [Saprospiraceae bacterium]|nr:T9SS type A sorting domain-containing protein [Saprospiraceae bacterium]
MKAIYRPFSRKYRQLRFLSKKFERLVQSGRWQELSIDKKKGILSRLRRLYRDLASVFTKASLRKALAGAAFLLGAYAAQAQPFAAGEVNPFGWTNQYDFPVNGFGDIDNDGDLDMFASSFGPANPYWNVKFFQNVGTTSAPDFPDPPSGAFGVNEPDLTNPVLVDLDSDGDLDMFVGHAFGDGSVYYYENLGTANLPAFGAAQVNPFGLTSGYFFNFLDVMDLDGDGDFDLIHTTQQGIFTYFENTGTPQAPAFAAGVTDPFGLDQSLGVYFVRLMDFADFDRDGDQDVIMTAYDGPNAIVNMFYQENIGSAEEPIFAPPVADPFSIPLPAETFFHPTLIDLDNDGDLDLLLAGYYDNLYYYENLAPVNAVPESEDTSVDVFINTDYLFAEADFPISDADGDMLAGVRIVSSVDMGTLNYNGVPVGMNEEIDLANLASLIYTPPADLFGNNFTSFDFKVFDGANYSTETYTMTVNVVMESAVSEAWRAARISLSPNPAETNLLIQASNLPGSSGLLEMRVFDALGRQIDMQQTEVFNAAMELNLNVSDYPSGWYSIQLVQGGTQRSLPFCVR